MANTADESALIERVRDLLGSFKTVLMATSSVEGEPEISYSPFCLRDGLLYLFISDLSLHTGNLKANPRASLLFIENEQSCENLHARQRATFAVRAERIDRAEPLFDEVLALMEQRFGEIAVLLKSLPDFHLFAMRPVSVNLVLGFAQAHNLECVVFPEVIA